MAGSKCVMWKKVELANAEMQTRMGFADVPKRGIIRSLYSVAFMYSQEGEGGQDARIEKQSKIWQTSRASPPLAHKEFI